MEKPIHSANSQESTQSSIHGREINWNQLFYFSVIAANSSVKEAAEALNLSPSTLSQHLSQLEKDLNILLFHRQVRKLTLTAEGQRLFNHTKEMFESSQRILGVVSPLKLGSYPVAVGLVPSPSLQVAYDLIGDFQAKHGSLGMKLKHSTYSQLEASLVNSEFDFGFSDRVPERKDLHSELLSSSKLKFYVASRLVSKSFASLVKELPLLVCDAESQGSSVMGRLLSEADINVSKTIISDFPSVLLELCQRGLGIGVFAEAPMNELESTGLRSLKSPTDAPKIKDRIFIVWLKSNEHSEVIQKLKTLLSHRKQMQ